MIAYKDIDILRPYYFIDKNNIYMDIACINEKETESTEDYNGRDVSITDIKFTDSQGVNYEINDARDDDNIMFYDKIGDALSDLKDMILKRMDDLETERLHLEAMLSYIDKKVLI